MKDMNKANIILVTMSLLLIFCLVGGCVQIGNPSSQTISLSKQNESLVKSLIKDLKNDTVKVRMNAAAALGDIGDKSAVLPLIEVIKKDNNISVRMYAAQSLGKLKDERAVEPLIAVLKNETESSVVRFMAAGALGEIKDERAVEPLIAVLKTGEREPYYIGKIGDPNYQIVFPSDDVFGAPTALGKIGNKRAISPLVEALGNPNAPDVATALAMFGEPAVDPLIEALKGPSNSYQLDGAIIALGLIGDKRATEPLIEIMKKERNYHIPEALGKIKDKRAVQPLIEQIPLLDLSNGAFEVELGYRQKVVYALGEIGPDAKDAVPVLIELVQNPDERGQSHEASSHVEKGSNILIFSGGEVVYYGSIREAIWALGNIGDKRAIPILETLTNDPDSGIRGRAKTALGKIKGSSSY